MKFLEIYIHLIGQVLTLLAAGGASGGRMSKIDVSMIFCYNFMILNNIHKKSTIIIKNLFN